MTPAYTHCERCAELERELLRTVWGRSCLRRAHAAIEAQALDRRIIETLQDVAERHEWMAEAAGRHGVSRERIKSALRRHPEEAARLQSLHAAARTKLLERCRELRGRGLAYAKIGAEIGLTGGGVRKLLIDHPPEQEQEPKPRPRLLGAARPKPAPAPPAWTGPAEVLPIAKCLTEVHRWTWAEAAGYLAPFNERWDPAALAAAAAAPTVADRQYAARLDRGALPA